MSCILNPEFKLLHDAALGVGCSVFAAFLIWIYWFWRIRSAAKSYYCGEWTAYKFEGRTLVPMENNPKATIKPGPRWLIHPEVLIIEGSHDSPPNLERRMLRGRISINPTAFERATVTLGYVNEAEYSIQDYFRLENGDIYVIPQTTKDYERHILRRSVNA